MDRYVKQIQGRQIVSCSTLVINDGDDDILNSVDVLIDALQNSSGIESVYMGQDFLGCVRCDTRSRLIKSLASCPSASSGILEQIHFSDCLLQISDLTSLLAQARGLKILSLKDVVLQGIPEHFDTCAAALYQHGSLKELRLEDCITAIRSIRLRTLIEAAQKHPQPGDLPRLTSTRTLHMIELTSGLA